MPESLEVMVARIDERTKNVHEKVGEIEEHLKRQNSTLAKHDDRLDAIEKNEVSFKWKLILIASAMGGGMGVGLGADKLLKLIGF